MFTDLIVRRFETDDLVTGLKFFLGKIKDV